MNEDNLSKKREEIGRKLNAIRAGVGASKVGFNVKKWIVTGEEFIEKIKKITPGEPLIINGNFIFAYINDHTYTNHFEYQQKVKNSPNECFKSGKKVHFYRCSTLKYMEKIKRSDRYCIVTSLKGNKCEIDLRDKNDVFARLAWCQNCLDILLENGNLPYYERGKLKSVAVVWGDSRKLLSCVKSYYRRSNAGKNEIQKFFLSLKEE